jgi:hypothetical protein
MAIIMADTVPSTGTPEAERIAAEDAAIATSGGGKVADTQFKVPEPAPQQEKTSG